MGHSKKSATHSESRPHSPSHVIAHIPSHIHAHSLSDWPWTTQYKGQEPWNVAPSLEILPCVLTSCPEFWNLAPNPKIFDSWFRSHDQQSKREPKMLYMFQKNWAILGCLGKPNPRKWMLSGHVICVPIPESWFVVPTPDFSSWIVKACPESFARVLE